MQVKGITYFVIGVAHFIAGGIEYKTKKIMLWLREYIWIIVYSILLI